MQTTLSPRHPLKIHGWPAAPIQRRALARVTSRAGDWHYASLPGWRYTWLAALLSASIHLLVLWGGGVRPVHRAVAAAPAEKVIQMEMPPLPDEEEEPVESLDQGDEIPAVEVPRLIDLPSTVSLNSFVQPLEMNSALQTSLDASKLTAIPVRIATAGSRPGAGLKNLFDISQLDRVPEPIAQPAPNFPPELQKETEYAEVVVEFIVDTKGLPRDVTAMTSTHPGFVRAAVDGVSRWRFRAGIKDGRKVNTRVRIPIQFRVTDV